MSNINYSVILISFYASAIAKILSNGKDTFVN